METPPSRKRSTDMEMMSVIFRPDDKQIDILKICSAIWESSERNVRVYSDLLREFLDDKRTFEEIEFYLPQIAHMIINLGNSNLELARGLERLALGLCQQSMHTALQLTFILKAALEDFQAELPNGQINPAASTQLFNKCAVLIEHIERVVVFGSTPLGMHDLSKNDKIINEVVLADSNAENKKPTSIASAMLFKRTTRKSFYHTKRWKIRYFKIDNASLYCYHDPECKQLLRSLSLLDAKVVVPTDSKYEWYMQVQSTVSSLMFHMRATTVEAFDAWKAELEFQISKPPLLIRANRSVSFSTTNDSISPSDEPMDSNGSPIKNQSRSMTLEEEKRFKFFRGEMKLLKDLTDISESLRFVDRPERRDVLKRKLAQLQVPPLSYLPLCKSTDAFRTILCTLPNECHAFSTKARVPALILFELEEHPHMTDVATFETLELTDAYQEGFDVDEGIASRFKPENADNEVQSAGIWREEGTVVVERIVKGVTKLLSVSKLPVEQSVEHSAVDNADPVMASVGGHVSIGDIAETFADRAARLRTVSKFGALAGWKLGGLLAKSNDDVRQEVFVMQLIMFYQKIFKAAGLPLWLHTYRIVSASKTTGLIELITDCISLDGLKKKEDYPGSLRLHFENAYKENIDAAIEEYVKSMAAYSVVTYLLAIKDRHNGNIMIDAAGHMIHIDFGFVFGLAPGKALSLEKAPWKLTVEMVEVMGGMDSAHFKMYADLCVQAFKVARVHYREVEALMDIMSYKSNYPAFKYNPNAIADFRDKLQLSIPDEKLPELIRDLIKKSFNHRGTRFYDQFQLATNKISP